MGLDKDIVTILTVIPILNLMLSFFYSKTENLNKYLYILNDIKFILFDYWKNENINIRPSHFERNVQKQRYDYYLKLDNLKIFQNTLSCPYIDANEVAKLISNNSNKKAVLDIGGYDGLFTLNLFCKLFYDDAQVEELVLVEPLSVKQEYTANMQKVISERKLKIFQIPFENWEINYTKKFDLILASHSLYSILDNNTASLERILKKLNGIIKKPSGEIVIILANKASRAYSYKRAVLNTVYGKISTDTNASDFYSDLEQYVNNLSFQINIVTVDNFINVSDLLFPNESSRITLNKWLSYFVRIPEVNDPHYLEYLQNLLYDYSSPLYELPQNVFNHYKDSVPFELDMESRILMHKTNVIHIKSI